MITSTFTILTLLVLSNLLAHFLFGPAIQETYFRLDTVSPIEGELFISETPTDFSSIEIRWPLICFSIASAFIALWVVVRSIASRRSSSRSHEETP